MTFVLTEEQEILQRTAREFVTGKSSLRRVRELRDDKTGEGFSRALWREMAELGWLGIVIPEQYGGAGLGYCDLMVVMEEAGRGLVPEPLLATVALGATAILQGGTDVQKQAHLPAVAAGDRLLALAAHEARGRFDLAHVETRAERTGAGFRLSGEKVAVLDGHVADCFVVSARTAGATRDARGVTLFLVPRSASGVAIERQHRIDGRGCALVHLRGVDVGTDAVLGALGEGGGLLARVVDRATIALTAEMLGSLGAAFQMTLDYLKTRQQFGKLIGSFQALKHRAARMFVEADLSRSVVMAACAAIDAGESDAQVARLASIAKARLSDAFILVGNETIQMHGGIGMTDEHDAGLFLKRARVAQLTFGDGAYHRDRVARIDGY
ncbi:MAG: acyl-CoA dehydrogenase family protein [Candidatus Binatia bacterium]